MKRILVIGAGRSSLYLIEYLQQYCIKTEGLLIICDQNTEAIESLLSSKDAIEYHQLSIQDQSLLEPLIQSADIVVSLLPAFLHVQIAEKCLEFNKHLATASYISPQMRDLHEAANAKGLVFLNEMGLDPGIDHMSAMCLFDQIHAKGGEITGFKSFCGGLVADEDDGDNPWRYKFSWNPRNVVLAAQGGDAHFLKDGQEMALTYQEVFDQIELIDVPGYGSLEAYANRDSLSYIQLYGLEGVNDLIRGTFRKPGYCKAWQTLIQFGLTDDQIHLSLPPTTTLSMFYQQVSGLTYQNTLALNSLLNGDQALLQKLLYIGFMSDDVLDKTTGTAASILESILVKKWMLCPQDKDLVIMLHDVAYTLNGQTHHQYSSLVLKGEDAHRTAMAKTVGLPLAIGVKMILEGRMHETGVLAPMHKSIYEPVMLELSSLGIVFNESHT